MAKFKFTLLANSQKEQIVEIPDEVLDPLEGHGYARTNRIHTEWKNWAELHRDGGYEEITEGENDD